MHLFANALHTPLLGIARQVAMATAGLPPGILDALAAISSHVLANAGLDGQPDDVFFSLKDKQFYIIRGGSR